MLPMTLNLGGYLVTRIYLRKSLSYKKCEDGLYASLFLPQKVAFLLH